MKTKLPCTKRRRHTRSLAFSGDSPKSARADRTLVIVLNSKNKFNCEFYSVYLKYNFSNPQTKENYIWLDVFQNCFSSLLSRLVLYRKIHLMYKFYKSSCTKRRRLTRSLAFNQATHPTTKARTKYAEPCTFYESVFNRVSAHFTKLLNTD